MKKLLSTIRIFYMFAKEPFIDIPEFCYMFEVWSENSKKNKTYNYGNTLSRYFVDIVRWAWELKYNWNKEYKQKIMRYNQKLHTFDKR